MRTFFNENKLTLKFIEKERFRNLKLTKAHP